MSLVALFPHGIAHYLVGGIVIGVGVSLLYVTTGLIGGMSTVLSSTWSYVSRYPFFHQAPLRASRQWRSFYAAGLLLGALTYVATLGQGEVVVTQVASWQLALGGFVAGFGARLSSGCTSGHGICGLASLQLPSFLAVCIFLTTAIVTANIVKLFGGA